MERITSKGFQIDLTVSFKANSSFTDLQYKYCRLFIADYIQLPRKCYYMISPHLMWGIPINIVDFIWGSKLQGLWVTCNPHKFEIPTL